MLLEIIDVLLVGIGILFFLCLITRTISYLLLTGLDNNSYTYFSYDYQIGFWLIYDKEVKPKYEWLKKLSNFVLVCAVRLFVVAITLLIIKNLVEHN